VPPVPTRPSLTLALALALGLLASPSRAWSDTPQVTKQRVRALLAPEQPLPDAIDPARGVLVATAPDAPRNVCGAAVGATLPALLGRIASRLRDVEQGAGTFHCENRPVPRCEIAITDASEPVIELRFAVAGPRLVLDAILRFDAARPPFADPARRQQWASTRLARRAPCPAAPAPAPPTRVTKLLLRELATGLRPLSDVIDPARGIVRASQPNCATDDCSGPAASHLCGAELDRALPRLRRALAHLVRAAEGGSFECGQRSSECELSEMIDEYSNVHHLAFRRRPDGNLALESWIDLDEALTSDASKAEQRRWANRLVRQARAAGCPAP
jgi:hypothetical protein